MTNCLTRDMARINKIFTTGKYNTPDNIIPDPLHLGIDAAGAYLDPHELYLNSIKASIRHSAKEEIEFAKGKERLLGVLVSKQRKSQLFGYPSSCFLLKLPRQSVSFYQQTQPTRFKPE